MLRRLAPPIRFIRGPVGTSCTHVERPKPSNIRRRNVRPGYVVVVAVVTAVAAAAVAAAAVAAAAVAATTIASVAARLAEHAALVYLLSPPPGASLHIDLPVEGVALRPIGADAWVRAVQHGARAV